MSTPDHDVIVLGAGTAGAAVAAFAAERGLRTLCVDARELDQAGARWVNGVTERAFHDAGLDLPQGEELVGRGGPFHLVAGWGPTRVQADASGHLEVDMRHLVARLQARARAAGATLLGKTRAVAVRDERGQTYRPTIEHARLEHSPAWLEVELSTGDAVRARYAIDASGLSGARLLCQPPVAREHLCAAAQANFRVADPQAARAFFAARGAALGQALCFTGVAGGYSIVNVTSDGHHASVLTGSISALDVPSGQALLDAFVAENRAWIGEKLFGGARAIPLRRPRDVIGCGRIALIGDAACQVFSAHGSGIGPGLVGARLLAESLASGAGPYGYAVAWQRRHGGLLGASDLFRRLSQDFTPEDLEALIQSGLMDARTVAAGMAQRVPAVPLAELPQKLGALARHPRLAARLAKTGARMALCHALYRRYPADARALPRWSRAAARLFAEAPDVAG